MGKNEHEREIKDILRRNSEYGFYLSFLKQVADEKKDNVIKRVALFPVIMENERFNVKEFKKSWIDNVRVFIMLFSI